MNTQELDELGSDEMRLEHKGYFVTKNGGLFVIWAGMPESSEQLAAVGIESGVTGCKIYIDAYMHGCIEGGKRRAALIRKALGL